MPVSSKASETALAMARQSGLSSLHVLFPGPDEAGLMRDAGMNYGPANRDRTHDPVYWSAGWAITAISVVLTVLVWVLLLVHVGGGAA